LEAEGRQESGVIGHFFAQQGDEIEARGAIGVSASLGKGLIIRISARTEG
jgi:hypothetical protein